MRPFDLRSIVILSLLVLPPLLQAQAPATKKAPADDPVDATPQAAPSDNPFGNVPEADLATNPFADDPEPAPSDDPFGTPVPAPKPAAPTDDPFGTPEPAPKPAPSDDPFGTPEPAPKPAAPTDDPFGTPVPAPEPAAPTDDPFGTPEPAPKPAPPTDDPFGTPEPAPKPAPPTDDPFGTPVPAPEPAAPTDDPFGTPVPAPKPAAPTDDPFGTPEPAPKPAPPTDDPFGPPVPAPEPAPKPAAPTDDPFGGTPEPKPEVEPKPAPKVEPKPEPLPVPSAPMPEPVTKPDVVLPSGNTPPPAAAVLPTVPPTVQPQNPQAVVFVGTYTRDTDAEGIYALRMDLVTGELSPVGLVAKTDNPSFLCFGRQKDVLYAVNEVNDYEGEKSGSVSAFLLDPYSLKTQLLSVYKTHGGAPCHLSIDGTGKNLLVANYHGGNLALFPIRTDGGLGNALQVVNHSGSGPDPKRQTAPHAHSVHVSPDNRFVLAADLGIDKVVVHLFDANVGYLEPYYGAALPPGSGPRHMAFSRQHLFVLNELSATLTRMTYDPTNCDLKADSTVSTLPSDYTGRKSTAEVVLGHQGKFVYASNRGHDSIAVFRNLADGLELVEIEKTGGQEPRNFTIAPGGKFLLAANQNSNTVNVFRIDPATGALEPTEFGAEVPSPVCLRVREHNFGIDPPMASRLRGSSSRRSGYGGVNYATPVNGFNNSYHGRSSHSRGVRWATPVR